MATQFANKPPVWFWIVAVLFLLWGAMGCFSWYQHLTVGPEAWGDPANIDYDRKLYASLPVWFNYVYGAAVVFGLFGALALLAGKRVARTLFLVSLIAVVIQFGYSFFATDLIAHKGAAKVVPFPLVIIAIAAIGVWFSGHATRRGWLR